MNVTVWSNGLEVTGDGTGIVSHAGLGLLRRLAEKTGVTGVRAGRVGADGVPDAGGDRGRRREDGAEAGCRGEYRPPARVVPDRGAARDAAGCAGRGPGAGRGDLHPDRRDRHPGAFTCACHTFLSQNLAFCRGQRLPGERRGCQGTATVGKVAP